MSSWIIFLSFRLSCWSGILPPLPDFLPFGGMLKRSVLTFAPLRLSDLLCAIPAPKNYTARKVCAFALVFSIKRKNHLPRWSANCKTCAHQARQTRYSRRICKLIALSDAYKPTSQTDILCCDIDCEVLEKHSPVQAVIQTNKMRSELLAEECFASNRWLLAVVSIVKSQSVPVEM